MEKVTGYDYIDSEIHDIVSYLSKGQQTQLIKLFQKTHSAGVSLGYIEGKKQSKEHSKSTK